MRIERGPETRQEKEAREFDERYSATLHAEVSFTIKRPTASQSPVPDCVPWELIDREISGSLSDCGYSVDNWYRVMDAADEIEQDVCRTFQGDIGSVCASAVAQCSGNAGYSALARESRERIAAGVR